MKRALKIGIAAYGAFAYFNYRNQMPGDTTPSLLIDLGATVTKLTGSAMTTSPDGRSQIASREGLRYAVYLDSAGYKTAGIGHLLRPADGALNVGDSVSDAQVQVWFNSDISHAENTVNYYVNVPLTQNQFDALVSAVFNLGSALFKNSDGSETQLLQMLNSYKYNDAAKQLLRFVHAGGVVVAGLETRRVSEYTQFMA